MHTRTLFTFTQDADIPLRHETFGKVFEILDCVHAVTDHHLQGRESHRTLERRVILISLFTRKTRDARRDTLRLEDTGEAVDHGRYHDF